MMYKDFESLFERFCIMTVDGNMTDEEVFNILKTKTTKDLFQKLQVKVFELNNKCIQNNTL